MDIPYFTSQAGKVADPRLKLGIELFLLIVPYTPCVVSGVGFSPSSARRNASIVIKLWLLTHCDFRPEGAKKPVPFRYTK